MRVIENCVPVQNIWNRTYGMPSSYSFSTLTLFHSIPIIILLYSFPACFANLKGLSAVPARWPANLSLSFELQSTPTPHQTIVASHSQRCRKTTAKRQKCSSLLIKTQFSRQEIFLSPNFSL